MSKYKMNDHVWLSESGRWVREVVIVQVQGDMYLIRFCDERGGGMRVRGSRLYASEEAAKATLRSTAVIHTNRGYAAPLLH